MRRRCRGSVLLLGVVLSRTLGCSNSTEPLPECTGDVQVGVIEGSVPEFNWTPQCSLSSLVVFDASDNPLWNVHAPAGTNSLQAPLRYGTVPSGATQEGALVELTPGVGYIVRVFRLVEQPPDQPVSLMAGEQNFRH